MVCCHRWQRTGGHGFPVDVKLTPEAVLEQWEKINNFDDGRADHPFDNASGLKSIMANMENKSKGKKEKKDNSEVLKAIEAAKAAKAEGTPFEYDERDVILYSKFPRSLVRSLPNKSQTSVLVPSVPTFRLSTRTTTTSRSSPPLVSFLPSTLLLPSLWQMLFPTSRL